MKVLFIGDIVGKPGRNILKELLPSLKKTYKPDIVIANVENASHGRGLTKKVYDFLVSELKLDVLTSGNHIWDQKDIMNHIDSYTHLIRPANFPSQVPGKGSLVLEVNGEQVGIINLMGRVFLPPYDDPFRKASSIVHEMRSKGVFNIIVDIHAEATSEKIAIARYLDGKVSAVLGTHTHVQTADEKILPNGTAFISDVGFAGAYDSILGMEKSPVIHRFLTSISCKFEPEEKGLRELNAVLVNIERKGKALKIARIQKIC